MDEQVSDQLIAEGQAQLERIRRFNKVIALEKLKEMDPYVFEYLTAALFEQFGYEATAATAGRDQGVDVYIRHGDNLSVIQCKRYDHNIGQPIIRDLYGTMIHNEAEAAYLVTTAMFTRHAEEWAENKPIHLVDGFTLVEWIMSISSPDLLSEPSNYQTGEPNPALENRSSAIKAIQAVKPLWYWSICALLVILGGFVAGFLYTRKDMQNEGNVIQVVSSDVTKEVVVVLYEGDEKDGIADLSTPDTDNSADDTLPTLMPETTLTKSLPTAVPISTLILVSTETPTLISVDTSLLTAALTAAPTSTSTLESRERPTATPTVADRPTEIARPIRNLAGINTRPPAQGIFAAYSSIQPTLDGDLSEWSEDGIVIEHLVSGYEMYSGPQDIAGRCWLAWSPDGLYLAIEVEDDIYRSGPAGTDMWMGDGLEIHFDTELAVDYRECVVNSDDYQIGVSFGPDLDEIRGYLWYPYDIEGTFDALGDVQPTEQGYQVELLLPWSLFNIPQDLSQDLLNATFGFNLSINDNDRDEQMQETIISLSPTRATYNDPTEWGTLLLR